MRLVGELLGTSARAFRQAPFGQFLDAVGNALDELGLVMAAGLLAKELCVLRAQLSDAELLQLADLYSEGLSMFDLLLRWCLDMKRFEQSRSGAR